MIDPVWKASCLMCLSSALLGPLLLVRKKTLLGEALSHACYPGVVIGVILSFMFIRDGASFFSVLLGGGISSYLAIVSIDFLKKNRVPLDGALSFILSGFFAVGLFIASLLQRSHPKIYREIQCYLLGQTATMVDFHVTIYTIFTLFLIGSLFLFYRPIHTFLFQSDYAKSIGIPIKKIDRLIAILVVLSIQIGLRSVGIVLMSAMLIAPAVAARQLAYRLPAIFFLSALFGSCSGFLGNLLSFAYSLPPGPLIAIVGSMFALTSLLFAPKQGFFFRLMRIGNFKYRCLEENVLKNLWKEGPLPFKVFRKKHPVHPLFLTFILHRLIQSGWVKKSKGSYLLTKDGEMKALKIVRIHRLWEVYLADHLGIGVEKVHRSAEEMEHIITEEMEKKLSQFLSHPLVDPHAQPIPQQEGI